MLSSSGSSYFEFKLILPHNIIFVFHLYVDDGIKLLVKNWFAVRGIISTSPLDSRLLAFLANLKAKMVD